MSAKTIAFKTPPRRSIDDFVSGTPTPDALQVMKPPVAIGPTKRLTIDIADDLHHRMRMHCAENRVSLADVVRALLAEKYPAAPETTPPSAS